MASILDISCLDLEGDFETQVEEVLKYIRMSKEDVENLQVLFDELYDIFNSIWRDCSITLFGSIVTGLAMKNSDVDLLVKLPPWLNQPSGTAVIQARRVLKKLPHHFSNVLAIHKAKVPLVKFYHVPTKVNCDVSFNFLNSIKNTKWLEYMMDLDRRVRPMTLIIKYWSKIVDITGTNLMSNYCLNLLVIFYLQQKNILPSARLLQTNARDDIYDNWNYAFSNLQYQPKNTENLYTLLGGFFLYYRNFEFTDYILSLYTGQLIDRKRFKMLDDINQEYKLYCDNVKSNRCRPLRLNTLVCVQDPFDHSRNVGVAIYASLLVRIVAQLQEAAAAFEREHATAFLRSLLWPRSAPAHAPAHAPASPDPAGAATKPKRGVHKRHIKRNVRNLKRQFNYMMKKTFANKE